MKAFLKSKLTFLVLGGALLVMALSIAALNSPSISHAAASTATISLAPAKAAAGAKVMVKGSGWTAGDAVSLTLDNSTTALAQATVAKNGTFEATLIVPANGTVGKHMVVAADATTQVTAQASLKVLAAPAHK